MSRLILKNISVAYDQGTIIHDLNISIEDGDIACLLGPSGCGKTTLLRAIAGFEPVISGTITLEEQFISSPQIYIAPEQRNIGMVFQDYALFPHLNVADNISFGIRKQPRKVKKQRIEELLELINLPNYGDYYPHELSTGQQQRIALARALAPRPRLVMMDEPFASQDVKLRNILAREVREILKHEGTTAILVTHDQFEAFAMADKIGVLQKGRLIQWDSGYNLYHQPVNHFIAQFIGQGSLIEGTVIDGGTVATALATISGDVPSNCKPDSKVDVLIRPDDIQLDENGAYSAHIISRVFRGADYLYTLQLDDKSEVTTFAPSHMVYQPGETVNINVDMKHLVVLQRSPQ